MYNILKIQLAYHNITCIKIAKSWIHFLDMVYDIDSVDPIVSIDPHYPPPLILIWTAT